MTLPVEFLLGLYLGLLTGIVPAFVAGGLGFLVRYVTGVSLPGFGVVVLALSIASVQGGLLGLVEPDIAQSPRLLVAVLVVLMLSLYAHNQGDKLGAELPRRLSLSRLRQRTLSADVIEFVGTVGQVTIRPTGEIRDMEGYPPLSTELRTTLRSGSWRLPPDLPLSELEVRLEERLRTDHDLADVAVSIDERARASIAAAPPVGGLSRRVPDGKRAVSVTTLVPSGLARGDEVALRTAGRTFLGTVLSVGLDADEGESPDSNPARETDEDDEDGETESRPSSAASTILGGVGRVTVALDPGDVDPLLDADSPRLAVRSRGTNRDFEAFALLRRAGYAIRRVTVDSAAEAEESLPLEDVTVLAVRRQDAEADDRRRGWVFPTDADPLLGVGDDVFLAGPETRVAATAEAIGGTSHSTPASDSARGDRI
jgi:hypothetical protein